MIARRLRLLRRLAPVGALLVAGGFGTACSLISTRDLTGGSESGAALIDACTGVGCDDGALACSADVQTDNANCGACGRACDGGTTCSSGTCVVGCPGKTMYVSTAAGADSNDGCTSGRAKKTVNGALTAVRANAALASAIHVCRGIYAETEFSLDVPVSLLGGYDCTTWTRTETYGAPTFDGVNQTTLRTGSTNPLTTTLTAGGGMVDATVQVDGFRIEGPPITPAGAVSTALTVTVGSTLRVTNNDIAGASPSASETYGLTISFAAAPEVAFNKINGGGGAQGTHAVFTNGAQAILHDNDVTAGTSSGGSVTGLGFISTFAPATAYRNVVRGGAGHGGGKSTGSIAIRIEGTAMITDNVVQGGVATCDPGVGCGSIAIAIIGKGTMYSSTIAGNRIFGGSTTVGTDGVVGIAVENNGPTYILNNAIQASNTQASTSTAIIIQKTRNVMIEQNTMYSADVAIDVDGSSSISARNNLFLGNPGTSVDGALLDRSCPRTVTPAVVAFSNNAFVDYGAVLGSLYTGQDDTHCDGADEASFADLAAVEPAITTTNNVRLAASCPTNEGASCLVEAACSTSADPAACIQLVLASWDDTSQGAADLLNDAQTWKLASAPLCLISRGGGSLLPAVDAAAPDGGTVSTSVDITGKLRTSPLSIGAYESDTACK